MEETMTAQLFAVGVALALVVAASPANARRDHEEQGPSLNGAMFQTHDAPTGFEVESVGLPDDSARPAGSTYARREHENQGPSLNGIMFRTRAANAGGFEIETVELPDGVLLGR
jgi:hypothetical protein